MNVEGADYRSHSSKLEKWAVHKLLKFLFGSAPVELDFQEGDIKKLNHPNPTIRVAPPRLWRLILILRNPNYHFPAAYVDGFWYCTKGELSDLVLQLKNRKRRNTRNSGLSFGLGELGIHIYRHYLRPSSLRETRKHYNTDVRMYRAVLGESLIYSCAFFESVSDTLEQAQANKVSTTLRRLADQIDEGTLTLDIGCGWGSFVFSAAKINEGRYHGISIAKSQVDYAVKTRRKLDKRIAERLEFFHCDFLDFRPDENNVYDYIVSIGMLEHVGKTQYPKYFAEIYRLLKPGGRALVHSITRRQTGVTNVWIDQHVFPGGYIPRASEVMRGIEGSGLELFSSHVHNGLNYKKTLQYWLDNLSRNEKLCLTLLKNSVVGAASLGGGGDILDYQSRRGYRIWKFYLSSIQCIFDRNGGAFDVTQFVMVKPSQETFLQREP